MHPSNGHVPKYTVGSNARPEGSSHYSKVGTQAVVQTAVLNHISSAVPVDGFVAVVLTRTFQFTSKPTGVDGFFLASKEKRFKGIRKREKCAASVSYTHLTLPTIYSV